MKHKTHSIAVGAAMIVTTLTWAGVSHAATIFNVNFDGANEVIGNAPITEAATASPIVNAHPTGVRSGDIAVEDAASKPDFSGFTNNQFALFSTSSSNDGMTFVPNTSDVHDSGTYTLTFDYRRSASDDWTKSFYISFNNDDGYLGRLYVSNTTGGLVIYRMGASAAATTSGGLDSFAADTDYTIQGVLEMTGGKSTVNFYVAKTGDPLQKLNTGATSDVVASGFTDVNLYGSKGGIMEIGIDNVVLEYNAVPEPASGALLLIAGLGMLSVRRHRKS